MAWGLLVIGTALGVAPVGVAAVALVVLLAASRRGDRPRGRGPYSDEGE
jgi:hypothetical protein